MIDLNKHFKFPMLERMKQCYMEYIEHLKTCGDCTEEELNRLYKNGENMTLPYECIITMITMFSYAYNLSQNGEERNEIMEYISTIIRSVREQTDEIQYIDRLMQMMNGKFHDDIVEMEKFSH